MIKLNVVFHFSVFVTMCFSFVGCISETKKDNNIISLDLSVSYSEKEIMLEEVADIEYLQLEVNENFLFNSNPSIITSEKIFLSNSNGDILVFSRSGKPLSKFNHRGGGPNDYAQLGRIIYDDKTDDLFVKSINKILVYSSTGEFKRVISLLDESNIIEIVNFDSESLLLYDDRNSYPSPFSLISKEDGSVVKTVNIPIDKKIDLFIVQQLDMDMFISTYASNHPIVRCCDGYLLTDYSIDTVYFLSRDRELSPILVRKPKIQSMESKIILNSYLEAGNFEFVYTVKLKVENRKLPRTYLMRDKKNGSVYRQKITFNDFKWKEVTLSPETIVNTQDSQLGLIILSLSELQDANSHNRLSGRLKELVDKSDEDGNNIYMFLHFK